MNDGFLLIVVIIFGVFVILMTYESILETKEKKKQEDESQFRIWVLIAAFVVVILALSE